MKVLTKIILLSLTLAVFSCDPDDDDPQPSTTTNNTVVTTPATTCSETVTSWYLEPYSGYNAGIYVGYGQYNVTTVNAYGFYTTYTDATRIPYVGMCWVY